jgi:hypothetical protein
LSVVVGPPDDVAIDAMEPKALTKPERHHTLP